jgi:hypothetical protein
MQQPTLCPENIVMSHGARSFPVGNFTSLLSMVLASLETVKPSGTVSRRSRVCLKGELDLRLRCTKRRWMCFCSARDSRIASISLAALIGSFFTALNPVCDAQ